MTKKIMIPLMGLTLAVLVGCTTNDGAHHKNQKHYKEHKHNKNHASTPSTRDLVGARGRDGENILNQRGFEWKRTTKINNSSYTFWKHKRSKQCIRVQTADGRYSSIVNAPAADCK